MPRFLIHFNTYITFVIIPIPKIGRKVVYIYAEHALLARNLRAIFTSFIVSPYIRIITL